MKKPLLAFLVIIILSLGCAPTTFLVGKDGNYTFFGRLNTDLGKNLCSTGALRAILDDASIPAIAKDGLFRYTCTQEYNHDMIVSIYTFMTPDEKKELMRAFGRHGYEVNMVHC